MREGAREQGSAPRRGFGAMAERAQGKRDEREKGRARAKAMHERTGQTIVVGSVLTGRQYHAFGIDRPLKHAPARVPMW